MLKTRCNQIIAALIITTPLLGFLPQRAFAQRNEADLTAFLLNGADCVISGSNNNRSRLYTETKPVAINRQIFDRLFSMGSANRGGNSTLACRANSQEYSIVDLRMGVTDNSAQSGATMTVNVYQGGNLKHTYNNVQAGTMVSVVLDLDDPEIASNPNSFAVEIFDCNAGSPDGACYLQFVEARLYPSGSFTSFSTPDDEVTTPQSTSVTPTSSQPQTSSSRQDNSPPEPTSSREDAPSTSSGGGILDRVLTDILEDIFN